MLNLLRRINSCQTSICSNETCLCSANKLKQNNFKNAHEIVFEIKKNDLIQINSYILLQL